VCDWKRVVHAFGMVSSWHATQLREIDPAADLGRFAFREKEDSWLWIRSP